MTILYATFKVNAQGFPSPTYQWYIGDQVNPADRTILDGKTSHILQLSSLEDPVFDGAQYSCKVTNSLGSTWSRRALLRVNSAPVFTLMPITQAVDVGATLTLTVSATGYPAPTFLWYKNDVLINDGGRVSGATTTTLVITSIESGDAGSYTCKATNTHGNATSDVAVITVNSGVTCLYSSGIDGTIGWDEDPINSFYSEPAGIPNGFQQMTPAYPETLVTGSRTLEFTPEIVSAYMHIAAVFDNYEAGSDTRYASTIIQQTNWKMELRMDTNYDITDVVRYTISILIYTGPSYNLVHSQPIVNDAFINSFPTTINGPGNAIFKAVQTAPNEITFYMNDISFYVATGYNMDTALAFKLNTTWIDFSLPVFHGYPTISQIKAGVLAGPNSCWPSCIDCGSGNKYYLDKTTFRDESFWTFGSDSFISNGAQYCVDPALTSGSGELTAINTSTPMHLTELSADLTMTASITGGNFYAAGGQQTTIAIADSIELGLISGIYDAGGGSFYFFVQQLVRDAGVPYIENLIYQLVDINPITFSYGANFKIKYESGNANFYINNSLVYSRAIDPDLGDPFKIKVSYARALDSSFSFNGYMSNILLVGPTQPNDCCS